MADKRKGRELLKKLSGRSMKEKLGKASRKRSMPSDVMLKMIKKMTGDLADATKKLSVHQDPKSKRSARLRSIIDQPRDKTPKSPHRDRKKHKYADAFKGKSKKS